MSDQAKTYSSWDGGTAFPSQPLSSDGTPLCEMDTGMSLRDWFASQALVGFLSNPSGPKSAGEVAKKRGLGSEEVLAHDAYEIADAMLKARAK